MLAYKQCSQYMNSLNFMEISYQPSIFLLNYLHCSSASRVTAVERGKSVVLSTSSPPDV